MRQKPWVEQWEHPGSTYVILFWRRVTQGINFPCLVFTLNLPSNARPCKVDLRELVNQIKDFGALESPSMTQGQCNPLVNLAIQVQGLKMAER